LKQCGTLRKNAAYFRTLAHLEKCTRLGKMRHIWKNAADVEKRGFPVETFGTVGEMRHTWNNAAHLEKCATLRKVRHSYKSAAHLDECGTLGKMRHTWKYFS